MNTMNMNGIYAANAAKEYASVSERSTSKEPDYEKGQILEGIVSKISDTVSINFDGKEMSFSKDAVQDAKEGQVRKFQIMDVSKNRIKGDRKRCFASKGRSYDLYLGKLWKNIFGVFSSGYERGIRRRKTDLSF